MFLFTLKAVKISQQRVYGKILNLLTDVFLVGIQSSIIYNTFIRGRELFELFNGG